MKIKNFIPSDNFKANGLVFKEMRNLKQVVALFGKNGSGKSRLLAHLPNEINTKIDLITNFNNNINGYLRHAETQKLNPNQEASFQSLKEEKDKLLLDMEYDDGDSLITITGRNIIIYAPDNMQESEYRSGTLNLVTNPNFQTVKENCAKFIKSLCKSEIAQEYHEKVKGKTHYLSHEEIQSKNIKLFNLLKEVVKEIMNKTLDYSTDEHLTPIVTLDKRILNPNELSDGEKELLAYCTFLVLQRQDDIPNKTLSLKNKILLLDEIELFLHPKAQIDLINGLRNLVGEHGQIWLATHSLSILSVLDRDEIWLMDNGDIISPSIETPNKVLTSLIGEDNVDSLENFISSQYEWASIQFALESLFPPAVIPFKEDDVQQNQVKDRLLSSSKPVKILDFGSGKGRIAQEIFRNKTLASNIYYQPLETNKEFHPELKNLTSQLQLVSNIDSHLEREVLDTYEKLNENQYHNFFDYIFLINVLHEIPLNKWNPILNTLLNSLTEDGHIIILEDQAIPRGENAHEYGFLIFDAEEFKLLFSRPNQPKVYKHKNPKYADRLTCIEIPKKGSTVTTETINEALARKKTNCKTEINNLRTKQNKTPKDGRQNSFLTQLYANVDMALFDTK
nr:AAA family ATPase [uncultured Fluviicola sp.]